MKSIMEHTYLEGGTIFERRNKSNIKILDAKV